MTNNHVMLESTTHHTIPGRWLQVPEAGEQLIAPT